MKHARPDYQAAIQAPESMIPADEPVFLLRGQDACAGNTVRFWAKQAARLGADPRIIEAADKIADQMDAWPVKKVPDLPV